MAIAAVDWQMFMVIFAFVMTLGIAFEKESALFYILSGFALWAMIDLAWSFFSFTSFFSVASFLVLVLAGLLLEVRGTMMMVEEARKGLA